MTTILEQEILGAIMNSKQAIVIDVSRYNGVWDLQVLIDSQLIPAIDAVIIRGGFAGSSGNNAMDVNYYKYHEISMRLKQINPRLRIGVYWYPTVHVAWERQRDFLYGRILESTEVDFIAFDIERAFNIINATFAVATSRLVKHTLQDYPHLQGLIYSNRWIYNELRSHTTAFDKYLYWHAQYPYSNWNVLGEYAKKYLTDTLLKLTNKPTLSNFRTEEEWFLWQIGANTYVGDNFGFSRESIDISVSQLPHLDFIAVLDANKSNTEPDPPPPIKLEIPQSVFDGLDYIETEANHIHEVLELMKG